jgi:hypothetical protein
MERQEICQAPTIPSYDVLNVSAGQYTYDAGGASYPGLGLNGTAANPDIKWESDQTTEYWYGYGVFCQPVTCYCGLLR